MGAGGGLALSPPPPTPTPPTRRSLAYFEYAGYGAMKPYGAGAGAVVAKVRFGRNADPQEDDAADGAARAAANATSSCERAELARALIPRNATHVEVALEGAESKPERERVAEVVDAVVETCVKRGVRILLNMAQDFDALPSLRGDNDTNETFGWVPDTFTADCLVRWTPHVSELLLSQFDGGDFADEEASFNDFLARWCDGLGSNLETLWLADVAYPIDVSPSLAQALARTTRLAEFRVTQDGWDAWSSGGPGFEDITEALSRLPWLDTVFLTGVDWCTAQKLGGSATLRDVGLLVGRTEKCDATKALAGILRGCPNLERLEVGTNDDEGPAEAHDALADALARAPRLKELVLDVQPPCAREPRARESDGVLWGLVGALRQGCDGLDKLRVENVPDKPGFLALVDAIEARRKRRAWNWPVSIDTYVELDEECERRKKEAGV